MLPSANPASATPAVTASPAEPPLMIACMPDTPYVSGRNGLIHWNGADSSSTGYRPPVDVSWIATTNSDTTSPARPRPIVSR